MFSRRISIHTYVKGMVLSDLGRYLFGETSVERINKIDHDMVKLLQHQICEIDSTYKTPENPTISSTVYPAI